MQAFMRALFLLMLLALVPTAAIADDDTLRIILEQQQQLRQDVDQGVEGLTPRQARIIRKAQDEFFAITQGKTSLDQLTIGDKIRVENALERINAQIANTSASRGDQNVCWRERKTGSKTVVTRCGTQEEIDQAREGARGFLERPRVCVPPGCGT